MFTVLLKSQIPMTLCTSLSVPCMSLTLVFCSREIHSPLWLYFMSACQRTFCPVTVFANWSLLTAWLSSNFHALCLEWCFLSSIKLPTFKNMSICLSEFPMCLDPSTRISVTNLSLVPWFNTQTRMKIVNPLKRMLMQQCTYFSIDLFINNICQPWHHS